MIKYYLLSNDNISSNILEINILWKSIYYRNQYIILIPMVIVGETTDTFRLRWNNYKDNDRKFQRNESCMLQHLYEHFCSKGINGFLGNVSTSLIDKTDGFQPKKRENYWMKTMKHVAQLGLNVESAV